MNLLAKEYEERIPKLVDLKLLSHDAIKQHGRTVFEKEAEVSFNSMLKATNNLAPYFITSFCIHSKDNYAYKHGLLSQWRGYGRGGFAIEFDEFEIDRISKEENAGWRYQGIISDSVEYRDYESRIKLEKFTNMSNPFLWRLIDKPTLPDYKRKKVNEILGTERIEDYADTFLEVTPFLKHKGFEEESEYRIVALCERPGRILDDQRKNKIFKFRAKSNGAIVPHIALYDGLDKPLPIKAVIIGPHALQDNQRTAVELLLEQNNIHAEVRVSELPFRD